MGGQVVRTEVSLDLDQSTPQLGAVDLAHEDLAQQVTLDGARVATEELRAEQFAAASRDCVAGTPVESGSSLSQTHPALGCRSSFAERAGAACQRRGPCRLSGTSPANPCQAARRPPRC